MTPYMCTVCGKAHVSAKDVKNCDHKKPQPKPKPKAKPQPKPTVTTAG